MRGGNLCPIAPGAGFARYTERIVLLAGEGGRRGIPKPRKAVPMEDFEFVSPTHFVFGHNAESKVGPMLAERGARKVLLHYGGQSAIKSGLIDRVCASLEQAGIEYVKPVSYTHLTLPTICSV